MIVRLNVKSNHPTISDIDDSGIRPGSKDYSGSFAGQEPQKWFAGLVATMLAPLRLKHRPFDFVGLATELLDRVANLFISQVRFLNLDRCHSSCSLALFIRRTVREPTIPPAMNPIISPQAAVLVIEPNNSAGNS